MNHLPKRSHYKTSILTIYTTWAKKRSLNFSRKAKKDIILVTLITINYKTERDKRVSVKMSNWFEKSQEMIMSSKALFMH